MNLREREAARSMATERGLMHEFRRTECLISVRAISPSVREAFDSRIGPRRKNPSEWMGFVHGRYTKARFASPGVL